MKASWIVRSATAVAVVALFAGCSSMNRTEKGTAIGAATGGVAGAVVGGPVGAAVGAGVGGYVGHEGTTRSASASTGTAPGNAAGTAYDTSVVRSAQEALNQRGYNPGAIDGQYGPDTQAAVRQFQQASGIAQTGDLDSRTLSALGVSR
jgi:peptidoglycan hydrolase-like protein with peptidoglycan-binding domain